MSRVVIGQTFVAMFDYEINKECSFIIVSYLSLVLKSV